MFTSVSSTSKTLRSPPRRGSVGNNKVLVRIALVLFLATQCCFCYDEICPTGGTLRTAAIDEATGEIFILFDHQTTSNVDDNDGGRDSGGARDNAPEKDDGERRRRRQQQLRRAANARPDDDDYEYDEYESLAGQQEVLRRSPSSSSSFSARNGIQHKNRRLVKDSDGNDVTFQVRQCLCDGESSRGAKGDDDASRGAGGGSEEAVQQHLLLCHARADYCGVSSAGDHHQVVSCFSSTIPEQIARHSMPYLLMCYGALVLLWLRYGQPAYQYVVAVIFKQPHRNEEFVDSILSDYRRSEQQQRRGGSRGQAPADDGTGGDATVAVGDGDDDDGPGGGGGGAGTTASSDQSGGGRPLNAAASSASSGGPGGWVQEWRQHHSWDRRVRTNLLARARYMIRNEEQERAQWRRKHNLPDSRMVLRVKKYYHNDDDDDDQQGKVSVVAQTGSLDDDTGTGNGESDMDVDDDVDDDTNSVDEPHCAICFVPLEGGDRVADLGCGHTFHIDCLASWATRRNACPLCNAPIAKCRRYSDEELRILLIRQRHEDRPQRCITKVLRPMHQEQPPAVATVNNSNDASQAAASEPEPVPTVSHHGPESEDEV